MPSAMLTIAEVERFLTTRFGDDIADVSPIAHGEWSRAFAYRDGDAERVVRFSALADDFHKDRLAMRYATAALPIPAIIEIGEAGDGFYAISQRARGGFLDELDAAVMRATLPALFAACDAMREADCSAFTGYGPWGADGHAAHPTWRAALLDVAHDRPGERTHGWRARLDASPTGSAPFDTAFGQMGALLDACPEERHLIHGDLLNFNVLVQPCRIEAVIDWGCAMYGDLLYDLAWFLYWAPWYPAWREIDFREEAANHYASIRLSVPHFEERLICYQIHIGLAAQAYNAFKGRWHALAETAARTREVARGA